MECKYAGPEAETYVKATLTLEGRWAVVHHKRDLANTGPLAFKSTKFLETQSQNSNADGIVPRQIRGKKRASLWVKYADSRHSTQYQQIRIQPFIEYPIKEHERQVSILKPCHFIIILAQVSPVTILGNSLSELEYSRLREEIYAIHIVYKKADLRPASGNSLKA